MNVVLVTRFYPPETGGGGIAAYAHYLAHGLAAQGHSVRVLSRSGLGRPSCARVGGVQVTRIAPPLIPYRLRRVPGCGRQIRFLNDVIYAVSVRRHLNAMLRAAQADIVEYADIDAEGLFHPNMMCASAVKLHAPHFVLQRYCHGATQPYDWRSVAALERRAILRAAGLSAPSYGLAAEVATEYGIPRSFIAYAANPIDTNLYAPLALDRGARANVLFVGRLELLKGATVFADAVPHIASAAPGVRFTIAGADRPDPSGNSTQATMQAMLERKGLAERVQFVGHAAPDVYRHLYQLSSVFVLPSLYENCPYTLLEAMACGRPCVVSNAHGMAEIVDHGVTGLTFNPGDSHDLAAKVLVLLQDPRLAAELGGAARQTAVGRFGVDAGVRQALTFYQRVTTTWAQRR